MGLDRNGGAAQADRLDNVGIERPLHEPCNIADLFFDKTRRGPIAFAAADLKYEISKNLLAQWRVTHLGMKLDAINAATLVLDGRQDLAGRCRRGEPIGNRRYMVAMAHPDIELE